MLLETRLTQPLVAAEVYVCGKCHFSRGSGEHGRNPWFVLKCFTGMKLRLSSLSISFSTVVVVCLICLCCIWRCSCGREDHLIVSGRTTQRLAGSYGPLAWGWGKMLLICFRLTWDPWQVISRAVLEWFHLRAWDCRAVHDKGKAW